MIGVSRFWALAVLVCWLIWPGAAEPAPEDSALPWADSVVDASSIVDKVIYGYQGWFNCDGDGSPIDLNSSAGGWRHWSNGDPPGPGFQTFELYPDLSDYPWFTLYETNYLELGNGEPAKLFSSHADEVVSLHFSWMKEHGLDGVALQRFGLDLRDPLRSANYPADNRDHIAGMVRAAAEQYGRIFYVMYDISGMSEQATPTATEFTRVIEQDWDEWVDHPERLNLVASPQYARQDGKPVVGIWGIGFKDRPGTAQQYRDLIGWFRARGCYVIGGVPKDWLGRTGSTTKTGFRDVFRSLDMIVPWSVGALTDDAEVDRWYWTDLLPEFLYCVRNGISYQPVLYPGFAWSNWKGGDPNRVPRRAGDLFWRQAYTIRKAGIRTAYIAMFDEYDEATAIAKAATDSSMIPVDQYFLTLSADGIYVSSDFYLRLAAKASQMIKGSLPPVPVVPIAPSPGPVFFRTGLEPGLDALPTWSDTVAQDGGGSTHVTGFGGAGSPECRVLEPDQAASGRHAIAYSGRDASESLSYVYFQVFDVHIPVSEATRLSFDFYPETDLARYVSVDLVTTDGATLRDSGAVDTAGTGMHPGAGRGVVGQWNRVTCRIGSRLNGTVIDRILIGYDHAADVGDFRGYIDNLTIEDVAD